MELNQIDLQKGIILADEFKNADIAIEQLAETLPTVVPPIQSKAEHDAIKKEIKPIKGLVTALEKRRKELKAPILDAGRLLDGEAKRLSGKLNGLIAPLIEADTEYKERAEREKQERQQYAQSKIDWMNDVIMRSFHMSSDEIQTAINEVTDLDTSQKFYELTGEATKLRDKTLNGLGEMLLMKKQQEQFKKEAPQTEPEPMQEAEDTDQEQQAIESLKTLEIGLSDAQAEAIIYAITDGEVANVVFTGTIQI